MDKQDDAQRAAMRDNILNLKRDAVINAARVYYDSLQGGAKPAQLNEMWRAVSYNVCDLVQEERRHGESHY